MRDRLAITEGKHGDLTAGHKFFYYQTIAGGTELLVQHNRLHACLCFFLRHADEYTLAKCQTVCLQHNRILAQFPDNQVPPPAIIKGLIAGCRDIVFLHQILGERLGAFQDRRILSRTEDPQSLRLEYIHNTADQRIIHADNGQINRIFLCESRQLIEFHRPDRNALCAIWPIPALPGAQ